MASLLSLRAVRGCVAAVISCAAIGCYWPLLVSSRCHWPVSAYCDYESYQLPVRTFIGQLLRAGTVPLWNPHLGLGMPVVGRQQSGLCDPLLTPLLLLFGAHSAMCFALFGHLVVMAWGQWKLATRLELDPVAAAVAVCLVLHNGFMHGHLLAGHINVIFAASMIPFVVLKALDLAEGRTDVPVGLAVWLSLMFLTGHPQTLYYSLLVAPPLAWCLTPRQRRRRAVGYTARWVVAAACGAGLSAVQLIPAVLLAIESREFSPRGTSEFARGLGLRAVDSFSLFIEWPMGSPWFAPRESGGLSFPHERSMWMGAAASGWLLLIWLRLVRVTRCQQVLTAFVVAALLTVWGHATPVSSLVSSLLDCLPGWNLFRCHGRIQSVLAPLWALSVAGSVSGPRPDTRDAGRMSGADAGGLLLRLAALLAVVVAVAGPSFGTVWRVGSRGMAARHDLGWAVGMLVTGVLLPAVCGLRGSRQSNSRAASGRSPIQTRPEQYRAAWVVGACVTVALIADPLRMGIRTMGCFDRPAREQLVGLPQGLRFLQSDRFPVVHADELRYSRLVSAAMTGDRSTPGTNEGGSVPAATERVFRALIENPSVAPQVLGCQWIVGSDGALQREIEQVLPIVRFVERSKRNERLLKRPVEQLTSSDLRELRRQLVRPCAVWTERSPHRLVVDVQLPRQATLVVADCFATSWSCVVNGERKDIEAAHRCLRSVRLSAGRSRVEMRYEPRQELWGLSVSLATGVILVVLTCGRRWSVGSRPEADR